MTTRPTPILLASLLVASQIAGASIRDLPPHPRLLFQAEAIQGLKRKVESPPWSDRWKRYKKEVDSRLNERIEPPPRGGAWMHWYVCPTHETALTPGNQVGEWSWEHVCEVGPHTLLGDPSDYRRDYDACVFAQIHLELAYLVRDVGVLFQVTGDRRYLDGGRRILMAYAARYRSYPLLSKIPDVPGDRGRVQSQSLDESTWLIPICQGADLLWPALSEEDRAILERELLLPAAGEVILPPAQGIHNTQCWRNSAAGLVGLLLGDDGLIGVAIDDARFGYRAQLSKGIGASGLWWEGSWGYHFYMLRGIWPLAEAARNCGVDLYDEKIRSAFRAPIRFAMPNGGLPTFNDGPEATLADPLYELAYARFGDPLLLSALNPGSREHRYALWFGEDELPSSFEEPAACMNDSIGGSVILRKGNGLATSWICLKYGEHGGGHGHPDKNSFILCSGGEVLAPDPSGRPYGSPLHTDWDRTTLAHNTLVVDERNQNPTTGRCLAFGCEGDARFAMVDAGPIYDGVRFVRTIVLLSENLMLCIDRVDADRTRTFDLSCHFGTGWIAGTAGGPAPPLRRAGYRRIRDAAAREEAGPVRFRVGTGSGREAAICLAGGDRTRVITGTGPGTTVDDRLPIIIFRRAAQRTTYVWGVSMDGSEIEVESPGAGDSRRVEAIVTGRDGRWQVLVDMDDRDVRALPLD